MPQTKAILSHEEKAAFRAFCSGRGVSEATMLRQMVRSVMDDALDQTATDGDGRRVKKLTVRLTEGEQDAVATLAEAEGFPTPTTWAAAVLRSAIHRDAVLNDAEIAVLRESIRELAAVGRNLNQIAHALNIEASPSNQARVTDGLIEAVGERVEDHKAAVSALVHRNLSRWELDDG